MNKGIEKRLTNCLLRIVLLIRANNALDRGNGFVAQSKIVHRIFKLLEHRSAELFTIPELRAELIFEHGNLGRMVALVRQKQGKVGENVVLCDTKDTVFFNRELDAIALKCCFCGRKG